MRGGRDDGGEERGRIRFIIKGNGQRKSRGGGGQLEGRALGS